MDNRSLQDNVWTLVDVKITSIIEKMNKIGIPLGNYINNELYFGLKTGLNRAFVINQETRNLLINEDRKNNNFIMPFALEMKFENIE